MTARADVDGDPELRSGSYTATVTLALLMIRAKRWDDDDDDVMTVKSRSCFTPRHRANPPFRSCEMNRDTQRHRVAPERRSLPHTGSLHTHTLIHIHAREDSTHARTSEKLHEIVGGKEKQYATLSSLSLIARGDYLSIYLSLSLSFAATSPAMRPARETEGERERGERERESERERVLCEVVCKVERDGYMYTRIRF